MDNTTPISSSIHQRDTDSSAIFSVSKGEVDVESVLGSGAFSTVYKVRLCCSIRGAPSLAAPLSDSSINSSCCISDSSCTFSYSGDEVYALKKLHGKSKDHKIGDPAAQDMLSEASLLAALPRHENIVTLHGVSKNFWNQPHRGFLLLDYLPESLESRLANWKGMRGHEDNVRERAMQVCLPVARAVAFLHQHNVCYRDLKPENIGFDANGNIRLYDFGFARLAKPGQTTLRNRVGTPRYMAPEVMKKEPYGTPADIYSFAVMAWEVLTLKKPYDAAMDFEHLMDMVAEDDIRPPTSALRGWKEIKATLSWSWHKDQQERPSADQVVEDMTKACQGHMKKSQNKSFVGMISLKPLRISLAPRAA